MKIPETSANIGAYYGNEDNIQWQPNGVIIDNGVGGGVVGSGDAGVHRPPVYPVHIQRGHIPGYVMAEAYYPAYPAPPAHPPHPAAPDDFADYMWMENEEEFDKQVMQQLEEEALMEQCIEAMLEDEQRERQRPVANGHNHFPTTSNGQPICSLEEAVSRSTLNPLAAEFVPTRVAPPPPPAEEKADNNTEEKPAEELKSPKEVTPQTEVIESKEIVEEKKTEVTPEQSETPEVSAADVQPIEKKKDVKKEQKKVVKQDVKVKPIAVKSETKVQKKKEVKSVKSETRVEEKVEDVVVVEITKQSPPPITEEAQSGIKPINYAAAAKANKPKKSTTPPIIEKIVKEKPKPIEKTEKKEKTPIKDVKPKTEKATVHRKNSTK
ncbi:PREDICTED: muscle M-line assembly protein unc-89 [Papilio polytes]|uniref:muscle M-line assembly protein unc-89 n=1 Tax=Papilio polytes TaxID=76194 RepID=UPI0006768967|nr:PREDICTED: muscle M-line assembly protein unc-89 [Papilio polytes]